MVVAGYLDSLGRTLGNSIVSSWWKLPIPAGWTFRHDRECTTITTPLQVTALQISAARKSGDVTDGDLREFADDHLTRGATTRGVEVGDFEGFVFAYRDESAHWRQWFLRRGNLAIFVTYNCPPKFKGHEDCVVDTVLAKLCINDGAP